MPSNKKIAVPTLFQIKLNNRISLLLGSDHRTQLDKLPEVCLEVIDQCRSLVMEESDEGMEDYYNRVIYQKAPHQPWTQNLPAPLKEKIMRYFNAGVEVILPYEQGKIDIDTLEIWAAYTFIDQGYMFLNLEREATDEEKKESMDVMSDERCMDHELARKFTRSQGKTYGLETYHESIWHNKKDARNFTKALKVGNYTAVEAALPGPDDGAAQNEYFKELGKGDFLKGVEVAYKEGLFLYDHHLAKLMDDDPVLTWRTRNWLPRFLQFHHTLPSPTLYVVGVAHLIGQRGLLSLLPQLIQGIEISYLGPQGFQPYNSPFNHHNISNHLIERALAVERRLNSTIAQEMLPSGDEKGKPRMIWLTTLPQDKNVLAKQECKKNHVLPTRTLSEKPQYPVIKSRGR